MQHEYFAPIRKLKEEANQGQWYFICITLLN
jgi:hypothetical protein